MKWQWAKVLDLCLLVVIMVWWEELGRRLPSITMIQFLFCLLGGEQSLEPQAVHLPL